jgi:hypothetical protein
MIHHQNSALVMFLASALTRGIHPLNVPPFGPAHLHVCLLNCLEVTYFRISYLIL